MGELLRAFKNGDRIAFERALQRALSTIKTESENVPKELKEIWAKEDAERAMATGKTSKTNTPIPKSLRDIWREEDAKRKLEE